MTSDPNTPLSSGLEVIHTDGVAGDGAATQGPDSPALPLTVPAVLTERALSDRRFRLRKMEDARGFAANMPWVQGGIEKSIAGLAAEVRFLEGIVAEVSAEIAAARRGVAA